MSEQAAKDFTPMFDIGDSEGVNPSERILARLCRKSFLRLWAQTNVHTDEGFRDGRGSTKELCDALVVFGRHVLIFSDKHVAFQQDRPADVAWGRWYRRAVVESVRQLHGAASWLRRFPGRVFLDAACQRPLPVAVPDGDDVVIHLIAVTRGTRDAARAASGGRGTLGVNTDVRGDAHLKAPFVIGIPSPGKAFVHVFDEAAIEIVLEELDTAADFIDYLSRRRVFLGSPGRTVIAFGEEDLLAAYLQNMDASGEEHQFLPAQANPSTDLVLFGESFYDELQKKQAYIDKKRADEISYVWDELVDRFIRIGDPTLHGLPLVQANEDLERGLRLLAAESRFHRRMLAEALKGVLANVSPGHSTARLADPGVVGMPVYVFVVVARRQGDSYDEYRRYRMAKLHAYTRTAKLFAPKGNTFVGLAMDNPHKDYEGSSEDLFVYSQAAWTDDELKELGKQRQELGLWRSNMRRQAWHASEFPRQKPRPASTSAQTKPGQSRKSDTEKRRKKMRQASQRKNRK